MIDGEIVVHLAIWRNIKNTVRGLYTVCFCVLSEQ